MADPSCDQVQFLHRNGSCVTCPTCGPGEQLSEDCGYGDGGEGRCVACGAGEFSVEDGLAPCWQCTQCSLLNREEREPCSPTGNADCGRCLRGFYGMKRKSGAIEAVCMPCYSPTGRIRKECQPSTSLPRHASTAGEEPVPISTALIGSVTAALAFFLVLFLWVLLLTVERLKQGPKSFTGPEGLSESQFAESLHMLLPCATPGREDQWAHGTEAMPRRLHSLSPEKDTSPPSIVINVTTNFKPSRQGRDSEWEGHEGAGHTPETQIPLEEMELKLQEIYAIAKGVFSNVTSIKKSIKRSISNAADLTLEELDYDTVQDLSLLLDAGSQGDGMRRLGRVLAVSPEVLGNLRGFQDLFQYLRTSTYTLLPQLARAAASLPRPDLVSRIHQGLVARLSCANANVNAKASASART